MTEEMRAQIMQFLDDAAGAERIGIAGHLRPDGDCVGACMALRGFLERSFGVKADVHLTEVPENVRFLKGSELIQTTFPYMRKGYDLFIALDCGDVSRLGKAKRYLKEAKKTYCIDHHASNSGFADVNMIYADAAATCEILYDVFECAADSRNESVSESMSYDEAVALYLGIVHDTGAFRHPNTTVHTMKIASELLKYDIPFTEIIDEAFEEKTYLQNQILGRCLVESELYFDGRVIVSVLNRKLQALYNMTGSDTDGVIDRMRMTRGIEIAILMKEMNPGVWRVGFRSRKDADVAKITAVFGGGGHPGAAGCVVTGSAKEVKAKVLETVEKVWLQNHEKVIYERNY